MIYEEPFLTGQYISVGSGNVAAAAAVATLPAEVGKTNFLAGFQITAAGATAALPVNVTITGLKGGTLTYTFVFPAGVLLAAQPLAVAFYPPLVASAANVAIVVTCPSGGAGNTNAACNAQGFQI